MDNILRVVQVAYEIVILEKKRWPHKYDNELAHVEFEKDQTRKEARKVIKKEMWNQISNPFKQEDKDHQ